MVVESGSRFDEAAFPNFWRGLCSAFFVSQSRNFALSLLKPVRGLSCFQMVSDCTSGHRVSRFRFGRKDGAEYCSIALPCLNAVTLELYGLFSKKE
jgi:hypothetical protein